MMDTFDQVYAKEIYSVSGKKVSTEAEIDFFITHLNDFLTLDQMQDLSEKITCALYQIDDCTEPKTPCHNSKLPKLTNCYKIKSIV